MSTVAVVFGIAVLFFYNDHDPPHFHAVSKVGRFRRRSISPIFRTAK